MEEKRGEHELNAQLRELTEKVRRLREELQAMTGKGQVCDLAPDERLRLQVRDKEPRG